MTTGRLESFSDGVGAIAVTLLVLLIPIPSANSASLIDQLGRLWPSYAAYGVSLVTIGIMWVDHHVQFARIARVDRTLLFLNLLLLMWVSQLPTSDGAGRENPRRGSRGADRDGGLRRRAPGDVDQLLRPVAPCAGGPPRP